MGFFFEKLILKILSRPKSLFSLDIIKPNETMAINKFQRSRLTFNFSGKVARIGVPSTH